MKTSAFLIALLIALPTPLVFAKGRVLECAITKLPSNDILHKGQCYYLPHKGGSFALLKAEGEGALYASVGMVTVYVMGRDTAEVTRLVKEEDGESRNDTWGEAKRSKADSACWEGADFRICAW